LADAIIGQMMEPVSFNLPVKKKKIEKKWALTGAKKRRPNIIRSLFLKKEVLEAHNQILRKKWEKIRRKEQRFSAYKTNDANYLIIAYGSQARIALEAVDILRKENIKVGLFRPITLWPYPEKGLKEIAKEIKKVLVVEQSLGQMIEDVKLSLPQKEIHFLGKAGGGIPSCEEIIKYLKKIL
jgi:2-oxoglutarate ferredoxin oxidoreductase subunit alpha